MLRYRVGAVLSALALATVSLQASAQAVRTGFNGTSDGRNDDGTFTTGGCNNGASGGTCSGTLVPIGFNANLFGTTFNSVYVNTNGNITLNSPYSTFTPQSLKGGGIPPILAPFFSDVDTRATASGVVSFGTGTVGTSNAFGVNWPDVGYFSEGTDKLNIFQLVMIDRNDTGAGNFDFEFNYNQVQWELGDADDGHGGLGTPGQSCAFAGYSNGLAGASNVSANLEGSGTCGALLDGGANALITHSLNSDVNGRYLFSVRNGEVVTPPPTTVPEPSSLALLGTGLFALVPMMKRRIRRA
jgi:hypothetical protein